MSKREYCHTISQQYNCPRCLLIDLEKASNEIKELENKLTNYMLGFATQTEHCELLEAKLSIAVETLELLEKYKAYNGDDWVSVESKKALEKLRGESV